MKKLTLILTLFVSLTTFAQKDSIVGFGTSITAFNYPARFLTVVIVPWEIGFLKYLNGDQHLDI